MSDNSEQIFGGGGIIDKWNDASVKSELDEIKAMLQNIGGGVKAVYRGTTTGAQTVELPAAVNMNKSFIYSVSKGSAGYVAARGSISGRGDIMAATKASGSDNTLTYGKIVGNVRENSYMNVTDSWNNAFAAAQQKLSGEPSKPTYISLSESISGGSTDLTVKEYSARLIDETHIQTDGAVEWQLIEYN